MPQITQEMIDRGDIVDPELIEKYQETLDKDEEDDEDEVPVVDDDDDQGDEDDDDEDAGEGDPEEEDKEEEQPGSQEEEDLGEEQESDEEDEDTGDEGNRIPLSRLNKALSKNKEAAAALEAEQNRTAWLEKQLEELIAAKKLPEKEEVVEDPFDFAEAETQYVDLILEGETAKAAALRSQIDGERIALIREDIQKSKGETTAEIAANREAEEFSLVVDNFENKYPFMDVSHDDYNEEAVDTTNALMAGFQSSGMSRVEALEKAVKRVAPMYHKEVAPQPKKGLGERNKAARKKNLETLKKTPPKSRSKKRVDRNLEDIKVEDLPRKEYKQLTKREKAILRGDIVE